MAAERPIDPALRVHFTDVPAPDLAPFLLQAQEEEARSDRRAALARAVTERRAELQDWLRADSANADLLVADPVEALRRALPGIPDPEPAPGTRELLERIALRGPHVDAGVVVFTPPEVLAAQLLSDVAQDAAQRPTGYDELFADLPGTVTRVEAGRYGADAIARVVAALAFVRGLPVPPAPAPIARPAHSWVADLLDDHPEIRERLG